MTMFIGKFEQRGEVSNYIYYDWNEWQKDTFSPEMENIAILNFKIGGKTYEERKNSLRELAIDWQLSFSDLPWSWEELAEIQDYFYTNGKKYGLLTEFKENAIC